LAAFVGGTTTASATSFTYDGPSIARVDAREMEAAEASPAQPSDMREGSVCRSTEERGTSTTASATFIATEAGSRGLSSLGGIIEETGVNSAGGRIFTSTGDIAQKDFAGIVNGGLTRGDQVSILTGAHGAADGSLIADTSMYADDLRAFGDLPGVHVYNVASMTPAEIGAVLNGPGTIIGGFCNSGACLAPYGG
jgi:hypothetical protein